MVPTRRSLGRGMLAGLATIGLQAVFAFSATVAQEQPRKGGTLVYALGGDPPHLNIAITSDLNAQQVATQISANAPR